MQKSFYKKILTSTTSGILFLGVSIFFIGGILQASAEETPVMLQDVAPLTSSSPESAQSEATATPLMLQGAAPAVTSPDGLQYDPITRQYTRINSTFDEENPLSSVLDDQYAPPSNPGEDSELWATESGKLLEGLNCGGSLRSGVDFSGCLPIVIYNLVFRPASFLLSIAASLFDYSLSLSIDRTLIDQEFVQNAWTIMRDFANMAFIFILLYAGITTILGGDDWRRTVIQVVIVALFINFSLLFTKIIIDSGNILAVGIYSALGPDPQDSGGVGVQKREISGNLVEALQPQRFTDAASAGDAFEAIVVFIIAAIVNVAVAWAFFKVALVFLGRLIGFWVLMIISPIAFISTATPKGEIFHDWLHKLINITFVAPVFLFFMYLILLVLQSDFITSLQDSLGGTTGFMSSKLLLPSMVAIVLVYMISKAVSIAEHMAGEFGNLGSQVGGKLMGVAGGVALGGAASIGRSALGGVASRVFDSGKLQKMATEGGAMGRFAGRNLTFATDKLRNASFDARNVGVIAAGIKQTGIDAGKAGGKGGFVKEEKAWIESEQKKAKLFEATKEEGAKIKADATVVAQKAVDDAKKVAEKNTGERERLDQSFKKAQEAQRETAQQVGQAADKFTQAFKELEQLKANRGSIQDITKAEAAVATAQNDLATKKQTNDSANASLDSAKNFLAEAKKAEKEALDAVKKASETAGKAGDEALKTANKNRRGAYAEHSIETDLTVQLNLSRSLKNLQKLKGKIEEGPHEEDPYKKLLEQAKKDAAEAIKKEGGEDGGSTPEPSGGGDHH